MRRVRPCDFATAGWYEEPFREDLTCRRGERTAAGVLKLI
jgi:hypothetical protein